MDAADTMATGVEVRVDDGRIFAMDGTVDTEVPPACVARSALLRDVLAARGAAQLAVSPAHWSAWTQMVSRGALPDSGEVFVHLLEARLSER
jgi:hypothetical protein